MRKTKSLFLNFTILLSICFFNQTALAQLKQDIPTDVSSSTMRYDDAKQTVVFEGNVHVKRPDFDLKANKITLYFAKKSNKAGQGEGSEDNGLGMQMQAGSIDRIVAEENVRITKEDKTGTCNIGTYSASTGVLTMEGNPVITDAKNNSIRGQVIKFNINENRSEVIGGVKASFSSKAGKTSIKGK